ncbi:Response regulator [Rubellimicrobium thermophilum DSM 16684]|uniref:Response regulator n=1 Tax=Rubellimicrobium thermophilum DSM 16684 TaxID=1123069 RepID=S9QUK4_9RHOB|nr:response regulator [Rubellimicrobium thermophilum]EPX83318.1 Response regulator [Rubellimicrobium thermophilum DSM 16684]
MTERASLSGKRILVVEDEAIVAMLIEDILTDHGAAVVGPAARIETALELADGEAIDAALLDVNLAGATTAPVAERLRARGIPFAFATGYGTSGLPAGFESSPLLQKPFQEQDLTAVLSRTLEA